MTDKEWDWGDLTPDQMNANLGTIEGTAALGRSLEAFGAGRGINVDRDGNIIAGNKTAEQASLRGFKLKVVDVAPDEILAARRPDLDLYSETDPTARNLATADNAIGAMNLNWDFSALQAAEESGADATEWLWTPSQWEALAIEAAQKDQAAAAAADGPQEPLNVPDIPEPNRTRRTIVIVECTNEDEQADVTEFCLNRGIRWRTP